MMIRYKQQVDARKFPYDKLVVSLRETMGFLTRNFTNLCSSAHEPMFMASRTYVLQIFLFVMMMVVGVNVWGQTTGLYYIANNNDKDPRYSSSTPTTNYYLVPASNGGDALIDLNRWAWNNDTATPFVTTYQTNCDNNSIWVIKESDTTGDYYLIHVLSGKYMTRNDGVGSNKNRRVFHMEDPTSLGNDHLFNFTSHIGTPTFYSINSKPLSSGHRFLNPSKANKNQYYGYESTEGGYWIGGLIGTYSSDANGDAGSKWFLETASVLFAPTISDVDIVTSKVTVSDNNGLPSGYNVRYTFSSDGTAPADPVATSNVMPADGLSITEEGILKVVIERYGVVLTGVAIKSVEPTDKCKKPVITKGNHVFTITCNYPTSGVTIYYTTDAETTEEQLAASPTTYGTIYPNGGVSFTDYDFTVKAVATAAGFKNSAVTIQYIGEDLTGDGTLESPYLIRSNKEFGTFVGNVNSPEGAAKHYKLMANVNGGAEVTEPFTGTFEAGTDGEGNFYKISGLSHALFNSLNGGTVKNVMLDDVRITSGINVGAIANEVTGDSRIYNCGILGTLTETKDDYGNVTNITSTSSISGSGYVGSIVGLLDGTSRVINCYSFATVSGGTMAAGIVGNNNQASTQSNLKTIVVNCMFYGDIKGGTSKYPVYGGNSINNDAADGINPYCYFRKNATFTPTAYNRSWPAEEKNLTRFEYYRSVLNSNRKLCTWWVNGTDGTAPTDEDVSDVGIAKWVLDPSIAPYPILKPWGKYPSIINLDPTRVWDPRTEDADGNTVTPHWVQRSNANEWEGKSYGTLSVTINAGSHGSGSTSTSRDIPITDMDTLNYDYSYYKIQLPYYNEVFGNLNGATHAAKYAGNYTDYVVTGWEISGGSDAEDYNFVDRSSYNGRIFAQGGYFYVPKNVSSITITAHWGKAVYLTNRGYSIDRVNVTAGGYRNAGKTEANNFSPAGTVSNTFEGYTVYDDLQTAISNLGSSSDYPTVYDQAIVLIGNHQVKNGSQGVAGAANNWHPFTIMSADFDFDNEPDYCLQLQFREGVDRPGIQPIRFDFLPVIELGLAVRHNNLAYAIGIFIPQGHFEITETSFMRTTQFEWDSRNITKMDTGPVILNGGEFEQIAVRYANGNRTNYFLLGGHLWFHRFAPGFHPNRGNDNNPTIRLCPVNVIGGDYPEFYLSGLYRPDKPAFADQGDPICYISGGHFGTIHGSGYDKITGNVTFKIDHAVIGEFYGGGINGSNPIGGNIDVTIDNSRVDKYCGGPEVGDMTGKTVTTHATGTTFGVFYGGGNGGNSYYRQLQFDGDQSSSNIGNWNTNGQSTYRWETFNPLGVYDDDTAAENKGYHAEYEFEVFNQSNGVADQITQRGFIKWLQFGITITGNVSNTLSNCKILNNFYGGGNLATVDGTVTSTLTNTVVDGSAFGAGYSAAIPTFQVHDKSTASFPSITAGVITDGHIDHNSNVYEWTNDLNGKTEAQRKADPTYEKDGKWYCYTWNSLDNLGAVLNSASLTINGNSVIGTASDSDTGNVYGGGDASAVSGDVTVNLQGNTEVLGNVFGGGNEGEVSGSATVNIMNEE